MNRNMWNKVVAIGMAFGMLTTSMPVLAFDDEVFEEEILENVSDYQDDLLVIGNADEEVTFDNRETEESIPIDNLEFYTVESENDSIILEDSLLDNQGIIEDETESYIEDEYLFNASEDEVIINNETFPDEYFRGYVSFEFDDNKDGKLSLTEIEDALFIDISLGIVSVGSRLNLDDKYADIESFIEDHYGEEYYDSWSEKRRSEGYDEIWETFSSIRSLEGIEYLTNIRFLGCAGIGLTDLNVTDNTELKCIDCSRNNLEALDLRNNLKLETVYCQSNSLSAVELPQTNTLKEINCRENQLETLNIANYPQLCYLRCSDNNLSSLNISQNTMITDLACDNNAITALDTSHNNNLERLDCSENQISVLDLSANTSLTGLDCSNNNIENININNNVDLRYVYCDKNHIKTLDISHNLKLIILSCFGNIIQSLNISDHNVLEQLYCYGNQISTLDVSKCVYLCKLCSICERRDQYDAWNNLGYAEYYLDYSGDWDNEEGPYTPGVTGSYILAIDPDLTVIGGSIEPFNLDDTYVFSNMNDKISKSIYYALFEKSIAQTIMKRDKGTGGQCYGMAVTAASSQVYRKPAPDSYGYSLFGLKATHLKDIGSAWSSKMTGVTASYYIKYAHLMQYLPNVDSLFDNDINRIVNEIKNALLVKKPLILAAGGLNSKGKLCGHALLPLGIKESDQKTEIMVYDCNYPLEKRIVTVYKNTSGHYAWEYSISDRSNLIWGNNGFISIYDTVGLLDEYYSSGASASVLGTYKRFNTSLFVSDSEQIAIDSDPAVEVTDTSFISTDRIKQVIPLTMSENDGNLLWLQSPEKVSVFGADDGLQCSISTESGGFNITGSEGSSATISFADSEKKSIEVETQYNSSVELSSFMQNDSDGKLDEIVITGNNDNTASFNQIDNGLTITGMGEYTATVSVDDESISKVFTVKADVDRTCVKYDDASIAVYCDSNNDGVYENKIQEISLITQNNTINTDLPHNIVTEQITISKKPTIKKPSATKNKITVSWKHFKQTKKTKKIWKKIKKVQIQCATDKAFTNIIKTSMVGKKKTKATIKGLSKKTTYYVRVRYYDGTGYSKWSSVKKVKTKK